MLSLRETAEQQFKQQWAEIVPTHRVLRHLSDSLRPDMLRLLSQSTDGLAPLLYDIVEKKRDANDSINHHWKNIFNALDAYMRALPANILLRLKTEYRDILLNQEGKFDSLVAAFPDLVAQKRFFTPEQFSLDDMHTGHLAYMIMGGLIKRSLDLFRDITGNKVVVYDPDNTITRQYGQNTVLDRH